MKDHKERSEHLDLFELEGPVEEAVEYLSKLAFGKVEPRLVVDWGYDDAALYLKYFVPLSDKEKRAAREKNAKARKAKKERDERDKAAAEAADLAAYERLKKKYG